MSSDTTTHSVRQKATHILLLAASYFVFGHASFLAQVDDVLVTPVLFAPEGIALAMALLFGVSVWPGVFFGQLALALSRGLALWPAASISVINSAELVLAVLLFRALKLDAGLPRARDLTGLLLLIFLVLQPFSATVGNATLWASGIVDRPALVSSWLNWWIGNSFGQMIVTPLLLALFKGGRTNRQTAGDFLVPLLVIMPAFWAADYLLRWTGVSSLVVIFAPILILLAIYRGLAAVCMGALLIALGALYATSHAFGPFVSENRADIPGMNLFIIGLALSGQYLSVFLSQTRAQQKLADELRDTREQLQRTAYELTENIPIGTYVLEFDAGGNPHFTFLSERYLAMTGLKREEVMANHALALQPMSPPDRSKIEQLNREVFASKKAFFWEGEITVRGEKRHVTLESVPRERPDGGTVWEGVMTDITESRKSEQQLRLVLDNIPVAVAENTLSSPAKITFINENFTRIFGYTLEDVPTVQDWAQRAFPDPAYRREVFREWDEAVFRAIESKGRVESMEFEVTCKDESRRHVVFSAAALPDRLLVTMTDITERKLAEQELDNVSRSMQLAASAAQLGFWELNVTTGLDRWDEEMARIHGITLAEFDGHWEKFVHPEDHDEVMRQTRQMLESDRIFEMEYRILRPGGEVRHIREHGIVVRDEQGLPLRASGVVQDITVQKTAAAREKELEAHHRRDLENKLKTSLAAAAVAHEINQPLSAILLRTKMALVEKRDGMEALSEVATEAQRVVTTIEKMKTLMRSVQTEHRAIDLGAVVRSALLYNKTLLARHKVGVRESGLDEAHTIMGDDAQLQLAITNILRNAAEAINESAAKQRHISIDLSTKNNEVILTIGDSGPGWSGAELAETPLATTKKGGTGIGLYVARTAMENHRGKISFGKSALGGAEVKMIFPQAG